MPADTDRKVVPVPIGEDAESDLQELIEATGLKQSDILRVSIAAALRALVENGKQVSVPLYLRVIDRPDRPHKYRA